MNQGKPNILFIFPDQWRGDCLGFFDKHPVQTPFIDELAEQSVVFTRAYSAHPTCVPSRASLLTGLTANKHGRLGYSDGIPWRYKNTFPELLRNGGYETLCVGKTHFFPPRVRLGFEQAKFYINQSGEDFQNTCDYQAWLKKESNGTVRDPGLEVCSDNSWYTRTWPGPEELHPNVWTTNEAIDYIDKSDPTRPFCLQVGYHRPHPPFDPPASFLKKYENIAPNEPVIGEWAAEYDEPIKKHLQEKWGILDKYKLEQLRKAYYAQLTAIDYEIGRLIWFLRRRSLLDNTIIVFSSDHGDALGDHNCFGKCTPFEPSVSIPFFTFFPKQFEVIPRIDDSTIVSHIDVMPTLLECAGLQIPSFCEGISLLSQSQENSQKPVRDFLHGEHSPGLRRSESWQFIIRKNDKYIWDATSGRERYFDLRKDPFEITDKINDNNYSDNIAECRGILINLLKQRNQDELVEGGKLKSGNPLPACREEILHPCLDYDGKTRPTEFWLGS
jgi:arylsulfatase